jgi:glycosyltransferase involved in cell wall biosynthesis
MFAGRVSPEKGVHTLLEAFDLVVKRYPAVQLVLSAGNGLAAWKKPSR